MEIIALFLLGGAYLLSSASNAPILGRAEAAGEQAKEDLARRKGIAKAEIAVVAIEAVDWPDTSLGCPEPDMMYAQVITPGYRIILSYAEETYEYHSDQGSKCKMQ